MVMGYMMVLDPSLYAHFEQSYGEQSQIFPKVNRGKIDIQCTYLGLVSQIVGLPASHGHGLHDGILDPSLYAHFESSYGEHWLIFPRMKCRKIYIQCTYPDLINEIMDQSPNHGHGLQHATLPSLYIHFEPSYGKQSQISPTLKYIKIDIQCTYPDLINQIMGD